MAIKERKQITGTTAQIDDYEGHEGQIVWDKEKKTFVGMSGTAGKNYPLAPKEYVDNKVAKCLPLTGGQVTGDIVFNTGAIFFSKGNGEHFRELLLGSDAKEDPSGNAGAYLALRNSGGSNESLRGTFALHTRLADSTAPYILEGKPNGELTWGGNRLVYTEVLKFYEGAGIAVRYSDGVQICCWKTHVDAKEVHISYPLPFTELWTRIVDHELAYSTGWNTSYIHVRNPRDASIGYFSYLAVGYWK